MIQKVKLRGICDLRLDRFFCFVSSRGIQVLFTSPRPEVNLVPREIFDQYVASRLRDEAEAEGSLYCRRSAE